jgi:hypothetical protein
VKEEMEYIFRCNLKREETIIGVQWVETENKVKFLMGNMATITVPCELFAEDKEGRLPSFEQPWVDDLGFTLKFGEYDIDPRKALYLDV